MAADLGTRAQRWPRPTCVNWRSATSTPQCSTTGPTVRGGTGTRPFDKIQVDSDKNARAAASTRGRPAAPAFRSSTPACARAAETGFMHNRVRMIVASFLVKDLHLPWQWGASAGSTTNSSTATWPTTSRSQGGARRGPAPLRQDHLTICPLSTGSATPVTYRPVEPHRYTIVSLMASGSTGGTANSGCCDGLKDGCSADHVAIASL